MFGGQHIKHSAKLFIGECLKPASYLTRHNVCPEIRLGSGTSCRALATVLCSERRTADRHRSGMEMACAQGHLVAWGGQQSPAMQRAIHLGIVMLNTEEGKAFAGEVKNILVTLVLEPVKEKMMSLYTMAKAHPKNSLAIFIVLVLLGVGLWSTFNGEVVFAEMAKYIPLFLASK